MTTTAVEGDTKAGNYFVSNYPPYSFWKPEQVPAVLDVLSKPPERDEKLGVYIHIPFCRKRCHFCYFRVYTGKRSKEIRQYLDDAIAELNTYAEKPFLKGRKPHFVYFGGGTPSYLSTTQLTELTDAMQAVFPWDDAEEITFECEPGTLTEHKVKFLRDVGITRLSLGVESFDPDILEVNGRAHRGQEIDRAWEWITNAGFPQTNIDLIAGMINETDETWAATVERAIEVSPDSITAYQMEIPYNTTIFKNMQDAGKVTAPVADWPTKRRWIDEAFKRFEEAGYTVTSTCTVVKDPAKTTFEYRDRLWTGADLLSAGVASFGHLGGVHYQNDHHIEGYQERLENGKLPIYRAYKLDEDERLIREFILQMKTGGVRAARFRERFGVDVAARFGDQLQALIDAGAMTRDGENFCLTREALLKVDSFLEPFFLPHHQDARYA